MIDFTDDIILSTQLTLKNLIDNLEDTLIVNAAEMHSILTTYAKFDFLL